MPSAAVHPSTIVSPTSGPTPGAGQSALAWLLIVLIVSFGFLYTSLFSLTGVPHLRSGDQAFFWTYASRLLSGQVFLKDFHQFTPPGTDLIYAAVFRTFGASIRSIDWTILWLGCALELACFAAARRILSSRMAALAALACVVVLYGDRMDATHHWFSSLANLLAVLTLMRGSTRWRIVGAAILVAVAAMFTQPAGVTGLLACCAGLWWEKRAGRISSREYAARTVGLAGVTFATWLLLSARFLAQAGVARYWAEQVTALPRYTRFPAGFLIPHFSSSLHVRSLISLADHIVVYLLLLAVCPWVASLCWRRRTEAREGAMGLFLLAALGILQTLEVLPALNWNRMAAVAMPSVILGVWLLTRIGATGRRLTTACVCIVGAMILVQSGATQVRRFPQLRLPAGNALLELDDVDELTWLAAHTRPGDCFFEVGNTRLYVALALRNPTPVDLLSPGGATLPEWVDESIAGLQQCATRYILWEPYPGLNPVEQRDPSEGDRLDPLRAYIRDEYAHRVIFPNGDEMWERRY